MKQSEAIVTLRLKNQVTLPADAIAALGVAPGDKLIIDVRYEDQVVQVRPARRSYRGALAGIYGDADEYVRKQRDSWE